MDYTVIVHPAEEGAGDRGLVDSDTHAPSDLLTEEYRCRVAQGAGLSEEEIERTLRENPRRLLAK